MRDLDSQEQELLRRGQELAEQRAAQQMRENALSSARAEADAILKTQKVALDCCGWSRNLLCASFFSLLSPPKPPGRVIGSMPLDLADESNAPVPGSVRRRRARGSRRCGTSWKRSGSSCWIKRGSGRPSWRTGSASWHRRSSGWRKSSGAPRSDQRASGSLSSRTSGSLRRLSRRLCRSSGP